MLRLILAGCMVLSSVAHAKTHESWLVVTDLWGNASYQSLELDIDGKNIAGMLDGDPIEGTRTGNTLRFDAKDNHASAYHYVATIAAASMSGTADVPDTNHADRRVTHAFRARRIADRPPGPPRTITFVPTDYSNEFSPHRAPVLTVWPGDTIRTTTIDSGGVDERGVTRALFGNPQTGPFYIAGANPGDTLVVHIKRLHLNRDYADSLDALVPRVLGPRLAADARDLGKPVRWTLDRERGIARPELPTDRLKAFEVPVHPMLGGLAVAPGFGSAPISTGDTGRFGGNMDFNEVVEGNTVYLPVFQPGALLYVGDAHALQGDGETSQYALETSMDVELIVDVVHGRSIAMPRVESKTEIMALGQAGSLDDAVRAATTGIAEWLQQDYGLTLSETAQVLGSSARYVVVNLAGRSVGVAAKIDKARLVALRRSDE